MILAGGNKSLYNDRVESFAAGAGEGLDRLFQLLIMEQIIDMFWFLMLRVCMQQGVKKV